MKAGFLGAAPGCVASPPAVEVEDESGPFPEESGGSEANSDTVREGERNEDSDGGSVIDG